MTVKWKCNALLMDSVEWRNRKTAGIGKVAELKNFRIRK